MRAFGVLFLVFLVSVVSSQEQREKRQSNGYYQQGGQILRQVPNPQLVQQRYAGLGGPPPQGFRSPASVRDDDDDDDGGLQRNQVTPGPAYAYRPLAAAPRQPQAVPIRAPPAARRPVPTRGPTSPSNQQQLEVEVEDEEEEKPDRLTELLPQSKFDCTGKKTGYYADDGLNCEVFHYCQDNARHSWICPEGFLFHQVHLICMPPSHDNICKQSAQYHFVNDYLYRPINEEEHQNKPNVSLRYSDRYYPESYYDAELEAAPAPPAAPQQHPQQQQQQQQQLYRPRPTGAAPIRQTYPPQVYRSSANQVFHSPEEVNIPLHQRRPLVTPSPTHRSFRNDDEYEYEEPSGYRQG